MKKRFFILVFLLLKNILYADFLTLPYIQGLSENSAYVLVESTTKDIVFVKYGLTTFYGMTSTSSSICTTTASTFTFVHKIKITGLICDSMYYISVEQSGSKTLFAAFRSIVSEKKDFKWVWLADSQTYTQIFDSLMNFICSKEPQFIIHGGDIADYGTYSYWKTQFFTNSAMRVLTKTASYSVIGNHEGWGQDTKAFTQVPVPFEGFPGYYSFDYGDVHFLILNTELPYSIGSEQYKFALSDLGNTKKKWKIVCSHKPAFINYGTKTQEKNQDLIDLFTYIFEPNNVDIVLSGHNHFYQHLKLGDVDHFIIGSAGGPLDPLASAPYVLKTVISYCYGIFEVANSKLKLSVYDLKDSLIDTVNWNKNNSSNIAWPDNYSLSQNYPNPFNSFTTINYSISNSVNVSIKIYDILGKEIKTIVNQYKETGNHSILFENLNLNSGIYIYKMTAGNYMTCKKMIVLK